MNYKDKIVWITGASSGIGKALVKKFYQEGAKVILSSRKEESLKQVAEEFQLNPSRYKILPLDLEKLTELNQKTADAIECFGVVDLCIHNGGISQRSLVEETEFSVDERLIQINYLSYVAITKALLPSMIKNGSGQFIVISSLVGKFGTPMRSGYSASKHALHGFFDSLRAELYSKNIKVLIVCPGFIKTNVSINAFTGDGSSQGKMDDAQENGMSVEKFSSVLLKALENNKEEISIGGKEKMGVLIKRFFPRVFSKMIRNAKVT
jgi:dehydrogenase/reductase SDR family member 7B